MRERERLEADLRRVLHDKADGLVVDDREFHPQTFTSATEPVVDRRPRRARVLLVATAVLAVIVGVAALVTTGGSSPHHLVQVRTGPSTAPAPNAAAGLEVDTPVVAPTWVPAGETLWSFTTTRVTYDGSSFTTQLIGLAPHNGQPQPAMYLEFQAVPSSEIPPGQTSITVRGAPARVSAPKDAPAAQSAIDWYESGAAITALTRGLSTAEAQSLLATLRPAGADLAVAGFAASSVPAPYEMLGQQPAATAGPDTTAVYGYWAGTPKPNTTPDIYVSTARHYTYPGYLRTAIGGSFDGAGAAISYDPWQGGTVIRATLDSVQVAVSTRKPISEATLERIARSAVLIDADRAAALRHDIDGRLNELPVVAQTTVALGTVTLRGSGGAIAACIELQDAAPSCSGVPAGDSTFSPPDYGRFAGGVVTARGWIVYSASVQPIVLGGVTPEHATIGGRDLLVALVPHSVDDVQISVPNDPRTVFGKMIVGSLTRPRNG